MGVGRLDALLRQRPAGVDPLELRRLVASVRQRVLARDEAASVGRYILREKLAQGGFGVVYRAHDPSTRRDVALKVLRPDIRRVTGRRLREEARALAAVDSQHVVEVLDFGQAQGREFVVMRLVGGTSLRSWTPETTEAALAVLRDVVDGVEAIHAQRLLHCDLKPENILIDAKGRAAIVDFGLAVRVDVIGEVGRTLGGTPPYCAPEQLCGEQIDLRVDQFSLGKIGLELLGRARERGNASEALASFRRAASRRREDRFRSVGELRRSLQGAAAGRSRGVLGAIVAAGVVGALGLGQLAEEPKPVEAPIEAKLDAPRDPLRIQLDDAYALFEAGDLDEAEAVLDAIPRRIWVDGDPSGQADGLSLRSGFAFARGETELGLEYLESAVWVALDADRNQTVALHATELSAQIAKHLGDADASERMSQLAWAAVQRDGNDPVLVARYWSTQAYVERFLGRPDRELVAAQAVIATLDATLQGVTWREEYDLGAAYLANERYAEARAAFLRALTSNRGDPRIVAIVTPSLAEAEYELGNKDAAIGLARAALEQSVAELGDDNPATVEARGRLGSMLILVDPREAVEHLKRVADSYGDGRSGLAILSRANLGRAMAEAGDAEGSERLLVRSVTELGVEGAAPAYDVAYVWGMLGDARHIGGRIEAAGDAYTQALSGLPDEHYASDLREDLRARRAKLDAVDGGAPARKDNASPSAQ